MLRIPGLIDIGTEITSGNWYAVSRKAVKSAYTTLIAAPSDEEVYSEKSQFNDSLEDVSRKSLCDYAKMGLITPENIRSITDWAEEVPAAFVNFAAFREAGSFAQMNLLTRLFSRWPEKKPICVLGGESQIGSAIFMAQVHHRRIHVCSVTTRAELELIDEARQSGIAVTCDIHPLSLLLSAEDPSKTQSPLKRMGTEDDRQALWQHFKNIDCFSSSGYSPQTPEYGAGLSMMLPLLLSMRNSEMLTTEDILLRCCVNPARLFGIRFDPQTVVEIDDTLPTDDPDEKNFVRSVRLHGQLVYTAEGFVPENPFIPFSSFRIRG
ncbi:MAG: hypothetical protein II969_17040 [Anaerolineaceae bacterium]|nr:hypothetical protein [Anaerolineaceae bacterium]